MAISVGQHIEAHGNSAAGTRTTSSVNTQASGSSFLIFILSNTNGPTVSDSMGNSYSTVDTAQGGNIGTFLYLCCYLCENGSGGTGHTFSSTNCYNIFAIEIVGGVTTSLVDTNQKAYDSAQAWVTASMTPTQDGDLIVCCCCEGSSGNPAALTPTYTSILDSVTNGASYWIGAVASLVQGSAAAFQESWSDSTGGSGGLVWQVAMKAAAGGGGTVVPVFINQYRQRRN